MIQEYINKYFFFIFTFSFIFVILLYELIGFKYTDELCVVALFALFLYGVFKTPNWSFHKVFLFTLGAFLFYTLYSIAIGSNGLRAIANDLIIQIKPYFGFFCVYQLKPFFNDSRKLILKQISLLAWFGFLLPIGVISLFYYEIIYIMLSHPAYYGITVTIVALCYFYSTNFNKENNIKFLLMLSIGILCGRSKFYGFFAMSFFIIVFYSNLRQFKLNIKNIMLVGAIVAVMMLVAWEKISLYFYQAISENPEVDPDMIARFVLYRTFPEILVDYFPLGSGLASYATHSSGVFYSHIYADYGIDGVWGISKTYSSFISDTFYPSLAQFGIVGIILFIMLWVYILRKAFYYIKNCITPQPQLFIIAILIVGFLAIESTTGSTFLAQGGFFTMMMLGMVLSNMEDELLKKGIKSPK